MTSASSSASSPAIDRSTSLVRKLSAEFDSKVEVVKGSEAVSSSSVNIESKKISKEPQQPQSLTSLEKNLFPSLEPTESQKVEEEFDKITGESKLDSLLKDESKIVGYYACLITGNMFCRGDARFVAATEDSLKYYLSQYTTNKELHIKKIRFEK